MVNLDRIRIDLEDQLAVDKEITTVDVIADTIEECLQDASVQLNTKISDLQYEVIEKGFQGIVGLMKKPWKLKVYENPKIIQAKKKAEAAAAEFDEMGLGGEAKIVDKDGFFYIHRFGSDICLKVILPTGSGNPVNTKEVINFAKREDTLEVYEDEVKRLCKSGTDGQYFPIGKFKHEPAGDASMAVDIAKDEMNATIYVSPPSMSGSEISPQAIKQALMTQGVVAGISEEKISEFIDMPVYNASYEVAHAIEPVDGRDAYISYNFETDRSKLKLQESDTGQVNFKELNLIQNVVEGQALAEKMLPQKGKGGKTVTGRYLEAKDGKDIKILLGQNVAFDSDGKTIIATKSGQVMLINDKITVEEIYEVNGVNIKTGNVSFMGTVICHGNVEDGFDIKADGNIEIYGSVGNSHIEAKGDIIISQGVMGRDEGTIKTEKSLWARFIQNTRVEVGDSVVVNDNIMNSEILAMKKIILRGKRAQIIGGHLFATEEITAKFIGSPGGGTETLLEVGFDPKAKQRLKELQESSSSLSKQLEEIELNISTLENQKKIRRSLPKEKEESLKKMMTERDTLSSQVLEISKEIEEIEKRLRELKVVGKVNASNTVYAGSKIVVRDEKDEVKNDVKAVTFYYDQGFVRRGKYDASAVTENVEAPDGYTSN